MTVVTPEAVSAEEVIPYEETDDPNLLVHIVNPPANPHLGQPGMSAQDVVDVARATGREVVALCGRRFVPRHDPDKGDVCSICILVAGRLMRGAGE